MNIIKNVQFFLASVSNKNITNLYPTDDNTVESLGIFPRESKKIVTVNNSLISTLIIISTLINNMLVIVTAISAVIALIMSISKKNKRGIIWSIVLLILPIICYFCLNIAKVLIYTVGTSGIGNTVSLIFILISIVIQIISIIASLIIAFKKQK